MIKSVNKPKIATILGARPQFIKAAVVSPVLAKFAQEIIVHTGQHFDANMSDIFFRELTLPSPEYHLNIQGGTHGDMTGRMLIEIEKVLKQEHPDMVLVYGDTNSTLAGALAAAKLNILIAHIEAGVRSFNRNMPEEINRILTDQLSSIYFVTSENAKENLQKEGCGLENIYTVGDVMYDLALQVSQQLFSAEVNTGNDYILVTLHRSENTDNIHRLKTLKCLIEKLSDIKRVVWIMHPRTKKALEAFQLEFPSDNKNISLLNPLGYKEMMGLVKEAYAIATDSGGLQKEAYYYKKPCITLRSETEWLELSDCGWNWVVGSDLQTDDVGAALEKIAVFLNKDFQKLPAPTIYGEGNAAEKIGQHLKQIFGV